MATLSYYPALKDLDDNLELPTEQVAYYNGVSPKTLRNLVARGLYPKPIDKKTRQSRDFWTARVTKDEMKMHGPLKGRGRT